MSRREHNDSGQSGQRHPPGLRGREIGMYYRNIAKQRKGERGDKVEKLNRLGPSVDVPPGVLALVMSAFDKYNTKTAMTECDKRSRADNFEQQFQHLLNVDFAAFIAESKAANENHEWSSEYLDEQLKHELDESRRDRVYCERLANRRKLPTMKYSTHICETIAAHQVLLIVGSTGCGKTTQVPQILLDAAIRDGNGGKCRIVCTQPRRISAITVAERVAYERAERIGNSVGYQIRLDSKLPRERASILYCTTGVLLQQLHSDPLMYGTSVLILDEIHERSVETDMLMGLLKKVLPHRPDLKLILMSATVREQDFCDYFTNCPLLRIEGVAFPVEEFYLEDVLKEMNYTLFLGDSNKRKRKGHGSRRAPKFDEYTRMIEPYVRNLRGIYDDWVLQSLRCPDSEGCANIEFITSLIHYISVEKPAGAILVFMPGFDKISKLHSALTKPAMGNTIWSKCLVVYPLHSIMPTVDQQAIFQRPPAGKRKVIISTILAETSVTIDDVVYVINTGRTKMSNYDIETNIQTLDEVWVTKANTQQRKGRAGRVQPGICYNLFTRAREATMSDVPTPQILCNRLESIILSLKLLHISDPYEFLQTLLSAPDPAAIRNGIALLKRIEALDEHGVLTPLGKHLAHLPIEPQMGKMILMSALFRCLDPITTAAAALSYKNPFFTPLGQERRVDAVKRSFDCSMHSDHLMVHNALAKYRRAQTQNDRNFCYDNFLTNSTLQQLERMKQQFAELLFNAKFLEEPKCQHAASNINANIMPLLRAIIAAGLYPNMALLRKSRRLKNKVRTLHHMQTDDGRRCNFHPSSVNSGEGGFESNYFVYLQKQKSTDLYLLDSTMIFPMALLIFGDEVETGKTPQNVAYISVGKAFRFKCEQETADVLLKLRWHLKQLLASKAMRPAPISIDEKHLITAIETLLALDEPLSDEDEAGEDDDDDDDDDDDGDVTDNVD